MKNAIRIFWILTFLCIRPGLAQEKPYVILISLDGFRWDYGSRGITPNLQDMAENGVQALSLQPVFPSKTFPNHLAMITGMYPENHGIILNNFSDPFTGRRYALRDRKAVQDARWYTGEALWETAERQGVICASYFWPGSELNLSYRRPTYFQYYDYLRPYRERVQGVLKWLQLPPADRPHFLTLYFEATDTQGHRFGPDAPETNHAIARVDSMIGLLRQGIAKLGMTGQVNVIVVSDHGMTAIDSTRQIHLDKTLGEIRCDIEERGPLMLLRPRNRSVDEVVHVLSQNAFHYRVYKREEIPKDFHYSHNSLIPPILVLADMGWSLVTDKLPVRGKGTHGYDANHLDMHGIFYASGPAFKHGYRTGTLRDIDIYPLICKILGVMPRQNIDGRLERIECVLQHDEQ